MDFKAALEPFNSKYAANPAILIEDGLGVVVSVAGSLDLEISHDLRSLFERVINGLDPGKRISVNLSAVNYISSMGVGTLINSLIQAQKRGVGFTLRKVPPQVDSILGVLGFSKFFNYENDDG